LPTVFTEGTASAHSDFDSGQGPKYWKAPEILYPNQTSKEPLVKDMRTYSAETYNSLVSLFNSMSSTTQDYMSAQSVLNGSFLMYSNPSTRHVMQKSDGSARVEIEPASNLIVEDDSDGQGRTLYVYWGNDTALYPRRYSRYYETVPFQTRPSDSPTGTKEWRNYKSSTKYIARAVYDESQIPESLRQTEYSGKAEGAASYQRHNSTNYASHWCFDCLSNDSTCGDVQQVTLEDGAIVEYRWYRWRDQPAMRSMAREFPEVYTESYLSELQSRVEKMHTAGWFTPGTSQSFLRRPRDTSLTEVERVLVMTPPAGKEVGWVPISLGQHYPPSLPSFDGGIMYQGQQNMY
jgi:hypothetical protein